MELNKVISKKLEYIINCIAEAGYVPAEQICGYLQTNEDTYITRTGNASERIKSIDCSELVKFVTQVGLQDNLCK